MKYIFEEAADGGGWVVSAYPDPGWPASAKYVATTFREAAEIVAHLEEEEETSTEEPLQ